MTTLPAWRRSPTSPRHRLRVASAVAITGSATAGVVHLAVVPEHVLEAWWIGVFFAGLGSAQLLLAVLLGRPHGPLTLVGAIVCTTGVVALYVASRTVDLWFLPAHEGVEHLPVAGGVGDGVPVLPGSRVEPVGPLDLLCLLAELVTVAALVALLPRRARNWTVDGLLLLAALGAAAVLLRA